MKKLCIPIILALCIVFFGAWNSDANTGGEGYYTVQKGDSLSGIALNLWGNPQLWPELWELNPQITDPNLIYPGERLVVTRVTITKKRYRKNQKKHAIRAMFKIRGFEFVEQNRLLAELFFYTDLVANAPSIPLLRHKTLELRRVLDRLEIYEIHEAIYRYTKDHEWGDLPLLLTALCWQESDFYNRKGKHGELSAFQIQPRFAQRALPGMNKADLLDRLEYDTNFATALVYGALVHYYKKYGSWEKALVRWNGSSKFAVEVMQKFRVLQQLT